MDKNDKEMLSLAIKYWMLVAVLALVINPIFLCYLLMWLGVLAFFFTLNWVYDAVHAPAKDAQKVEFSNGRKSEKAEAT
ncbi:MAG: hypothetical protein ACI9G1_000835 [Pirellulaceae bacterium]|jgi:hypothetical protein